MFDRYSDLMTMKELQAALQVGRNKAYQLIKSGDIRSIRIGKSIRVPKRFVIDYIVRTCYDGGAVDGCACSTEVTV